MTKALALLFLAILAILALPPALRADAGQTVQIQATDQMRYDVTRIDAAPGQKLTVTLTNVGKLPKAAMAHNFVLLKAGTDVNAFAAAAMMHQETGYIPPEMADKVIVATKLLGPGESDTVTFIAPAPGVYDYICTFPGHALAGMRGALNVK
ncbi:MAG: plastocyanin/azurin family copper-binding protein [Chthoniobacteraceae bacterium]|jgi:azurin